MNIDLKTIPTQATQALEKSKVFLPVIFGLLFAIMYGFFAIQILNLATAEPSNQAQSELDATVKRPEVNEVTIEAIRNADKNAAVTTERKPIVLKNPFNEAEIGIAEY